MREQTTRQNTTRNSNNRPVQTLALFLALATSALFLGSAHAAGGPSGSGTSIDSEPLVIFDVSGYGVAGPIHKHFALYSNGSASYSSLTVGGMWSDVTWVTPKRAQEINDDLIAAGALELTDRWSDSADIPMTTIAVFNGSRPNTTYNVFSFYEVEGGAYLAVVGLVEAFITQNFFE